MKRRNRAIRTMVLITSTIWTAFIFAQSPPHPIPVQTASIIDKLAWAGISLISPNSASKPVFLYGYDISDFEGMDAGAKGRILAANVSGNVSIAAIYRSGDCGSEWCALGLRGQDLSNYFPTNRSEENIQPEWPYCEGHSGQDGGYGQHCLIALSRPLSGHVIDLNDEEQFVAQPDFWSLHDPAANDNQR